MKDKHSKDEQIRIFRACLRMIAETCNLPALGMKKKHPKFAAGFEVISEEATTALTLAAEKK
jgi:hypothetical protein